MPALSATAAVLTALAVAVSAPAAAAQADTAAGAARGGTAGARPWLSSDQSPGQRADELLAKMTLAQKLQMVDGTGFGGGDYAGHIAGIPSLGVPDLYLADGAVGVGNGSTGVTWFPSGTTDAATWDPALVRAVGAADGTEQAAKGHNVSLAPNLNVLRTPYGGRAFEGYGEDPYLGSQIAAADVQGVQSAGVIATSKHYIGNDQETLRGTINAVVSQRALAEIYDPAFQATVDAGLGAVMCAYNKINGPYACENPQTLQGTLDHGLGFRGFVMSDWGAQHSTVPSAGAGLDMSMPGAGAIVPDYYGAPLAAAVAGGSVPVATVNGMVRRILWAMFSVGLFDRSYPNPAAVAGLDVSTPADNQVALNASEQGTVLLKNDHGVLPLSQKTKSIAVIGDAAGADAMYGGGGSASVNPTNPVTPLAGITGRAAASGAAVSYAQGNSNYRSLAAVPDTGFAPTSGPGPGWTATYYAGPAASGTPLGSEVVTSLDVTSIPAIVTAAGASTWSVSYTATMTPQASGIDEFALSAAAAASLSIGGRPVISYRPGTGSVFTGLVPVTTGRATAFEVDVTGLSAVIPATGPPRRGPLVGVTWAPQENLLWAAAARAAHTADVAVVFASNYSAEGSDLQTLELPADQDLLIQAVARANPHTVVVLNTSGPVYMPWLRQVAGVFEAWYPGQQYGHSIAALLFGDVNPSGHLPETFPADAHQGVAHGGTVLTPNPQFPGNGTDVYYSEGIDVGYRYYDVHHQTPLFPFGYGLSYTTFAYSHLRLAPWDRRSGQETAQVTITNTGKRAGAEVAQLYLTDPASAGEPPYQLKGFQKVTLAPGQSKTLTFRISRQDMSYYQTSAQRWVAASGRYLVSIGSSERTLALAGSFSAR
jgi:beta-glucosidase